MESIDIKEFKTHLKEFCKFNWKAKEIMESNNWNFMNLSEYQQKMIMTHMNINRITNTIIEL